ncbi:gluconokinase [Microbacterium sp. A196]|uniref:gluconokinase n=1 Tax=unclassified Microbacterium TaxID=2609290 RepID=UPI003FD2407A
MSDVSMQPHLVVMGVSGSGKSTVGKRIALELGADFVDADDLHPRENKERMAAGLPLRDSDRWPWLRTVGEHLATAPAGMVVACSALRRSYRDALRASDPSVIFVHLAGPRELVAQRMAGRGHEFMPDSLLASQYETLEDLESDEPHLEVDLRATPDEIAREVRAWLQSTELQARR